MFKRRFFIKQFLTFIIPLLIPALMLGALAYYTTQHDVKQELNQTSYQLLFQSQQQFDMVLEELDTLKLTLYSNSKMFNEISNILQVTEHTYESSISYQMINNYLSALTGSKPYIHSVYFYTANDQQRFLSSSGGITRIDEFADKSWLSEFLNVTEQRESWVSKREVKYYSFEEPYEILTFNYQIAPGKIGIFLNISPQFIEGIIENSTNYKEQSTFVIDGNRELIFSNDGSINFEDLPLETLLSVKEDNFSLNINGENYRVIKLHSDRYNWETISLIPHQVLYTVPNRILQFTLLFSLLSIGSGIILAYYFTRKNHRQIHQITSLLKAAEQNRSLNKPSEQYSDEYNYILHSMIQHFIEHHYITTQLSEKKYKLELSEMKALQSQIKPHFLYNTLNSIYWETLKLTGKPNKASEMIEVLSDMLSYSINHTDTLVTWEDELKNTDNYMEIQRVRYGEKISYCCEYEDQILSELTIRLLLQPILENSIYHGLQPKKTPGAIKVKIRKTKYFIQVSCIDTGVGMEKERLMELRERIKHYDSEADEHIGLINTYRRVQLVSDHKAYMQILSKKGYGTVVKLTLPVYHNPL